MHELKEAIGIHHSTMIGHWILSVDSGYEFDLGIDNANVSNVANVASKDAACPIKVQHGCEYLGAFNV